MPHRRRVSCLLGLVDTRRRCENPDASWLPDRMPVLARSRPGPASEGLEQAR